MDRNIFRRESYFTLKFRAPVNSAVCSDAYDKAGLTLLKYNLSHFAGTVSGRLSVALLFLYSALTLVLAENPWSV